MVENEFLANIMQLESLVTRVKTIVTEKEKDTLFKNDLLVELTTLFEMNYNKTLPSEKQSEVLNGQMGEQELKDYTKSIIESVRLDLKEQYV